MLWIPRIIFLFFATLLILFAAIGAAGVTIAGLWFFLGIPSNGEDRAMYFLCGFFVNVGFLAFTLAFFELIRKGERQIEIQNYWDMQGRKMRFQVQQWVSQQKWTPQAQRSAIRRMEDIRRNQPQTFSSHGQPNG